MADEDDEEEMTDRERGEKIIDILIPPCEWEDGERWIQRVGNGIRIQGHSFTPLICLFSPDKPIHFMK